MVLYLLCIFNNLSNINKNILDEKIINLMNYNPYNVRINYFISDAKAGFPYISKTPPWYVPLAEFGGGLGGGIAGEFIGSIIIFFGAFFLMGQPESELTNIESYLFMGTTTILTSIGTSTGIYLIGKEFGHRGSFLLTFFGTFFSSGIAIGMRARNYSDNLPIPFFFNESAIISCLVGSFFGTIFYQIGSNYVSK